MSRIRVWTSACWVVLSWSVVAVGANAQQVVDLPAEDRWLELRLEDVYRVGTVDGQDWEQFGSVADVAFDGAGSLYVFDDRGQRIVVVSPDGEYVREFGRVGEGPGEFKQATALAVARDGRAVVADVGHRVFHIFAANRTPVHRIRMNVVHGTLRGGRIVAWSGVDEVIGIPSASQSYFVSGPGGPPPPATSHAIERHDTDRAAGRDGYGRRAAALSARQRGRSRNVQSDRCPCSWPSLRCSRDCSAPSPPPCIGACWPMAAWRIRTPPTTRSRSPRRAGGSCAC